MSGKKGQRWSKSMTKQQRDEIALTKIENYMDSQMDKVLACPDCDKKYENVKDITPAQSALIRARYDKLRPTLSAVEQTVVSDADSASESQLINQLVSIIQARPDVLDTLIAMRQKASEAQDSHTPPVTH